MAVGGQYTHISNDLFQYTWQACLSRCRLSIIHSTVDLGDLIEAFCLSIDQSINHPAGRPVLGWG